MHHVRTADDFERQFDFVWKSCAANAGSVTTTGPWHVRRSLKPWPDSRLLQIDEPLSLHVRCSEPVSGTCVGRAQRAE
jgi:hypothetical protein